MELQAFSRSSRSPVAGAVGHPIRLFSRRPVSPLKIAALSLGERGGRTESLILYWASDIPLPTPPGTPDLHPGGQLSGGKAPFLANLSRNLNGATGSSLAPDPSCIPWGDGIPGGRVLRHFPRQRPHIQGVALARTTRLSHDMSLGLPHTIGPLHHRL